MGGLFDANMQIIRAIVQLAVLPVSARNGKI